MKETSTPTFHTPEKDLQRSPDAQILPLPFCNTNILRSIRSLGLILAVAACLAACGSGQRTDRPGGTTGARDVDPVFPGNSPLNSPGTRPGGTSSPQTALSGAGVLPTRNAWHIVLANFPNTPQGEQAAQRVLQRVRAEGRLPDAYIEARERRLVIAFGRYTGPNDRVGLRDLERIRTIELDGVRPYGAAVLGPPGTANLAVSIPEFDLRNAARRHPGALYTLQIAIYGRPDDRVPTADELAEFRRTAEDAVTELRRQGDAAFYYHDRHRSTVTVGTFNERDYNPRQSRGSMSFQLRQAMERHPSNLLNGQGIRQRIPGTDGSREEHWTLQSSFLVAIPGA
mgnify:CR=1 FL=1